MKSSIVALLIALALELLVVHEGSCSNIQVTNPTLGTLSSGSTTVTFDVTWTNSWLRVHHTGSLSQRVPSTLHDEGRDLSGAVGRIF